MLSWQSDNKSNSNGIIINKFTSHLWSNLKAVGSLILNESSLWVLSCLMALKVEPSNAVISFFISGSVDLRSKKLNLVSFKCFSFSKWFSLIHSFIYRFIQRAVIKWLLCFFFFSQRIPPFHPRSKM